MVKNLVLDSEQKTLLFQIKFTKIEFLHKFFWHVTTEFCTIVFRTDTFNRKIGNLHRLEKQEN